MAETLSGQSGKTKAIIVDEGKQCEGIDGGWETPDEKETGDAGEGKGRVA